MLRVSEPAQASGAELSREAIDEVLDLASALGCARCAGTRGNTDRPGTLPRASPRSTLCAWNPVSAARPWSLLLLLTGPTTCHSTNSSRPRRPATLASGCAPLKRWGMIVITHPPPRRPAGLGGHPGPAAGRDADAADPRRLRMALHTCRTTPPALGDRQYGDGERSGIRHPHATLLQPRPRRRRSPRPVGDAGGTRAPTQRPGRLTRSWRPNVSPAQPNRVLRCSRSRNACRRAGRSASPGVPVGLGGPNLDLHALAGEAQVQVSRRTHLGQPADRDGRRAGWYGPPPRRRSSRRWAKHLMPARVTAVGR